MFGKDENRGTRMGLIKGPGCGPVWRFVVRTRDRIWAPGANLAMMEATFVPWPWLSSAWSELAVLVGGRGGTVAGEWRASGAVWPQQGAGCGVPYRPACRL